MLQLVARWNMRTQHGTTVAVRKYAKMCDRKRLSCTLWRPPALTPSAISGLPRLALGPAWKVANPELSSVRRTVGPSGGSTRRRIRHVMLWLSMPELCATQHWRAALDERCSMEAITLMQ